MSEARGRRLVFDTLSLRGSNGGDGTKTEGTLGSARLREALVGYAFIAVPMGIFLTFFIYPLLYSLYISRYDWGVFGKIETLGWENYREIVARRDLLAVDQEHAAVHAWSSSRSRWRSRCRSQ